MERTVTMDGICKQSEAFNHDLTIIVNSCDAYEDAWYPFFKLLKEQWPGSEQYEIILNTETKSYDCDFLNVRTICTGSELPWTERLKLVLRQITTNNVLMFLEDFFLLEPVDQSLFDEVFNSFVSDPKIGIACLKTSDQQKIPPQKSKKYNHYFRYLSKHYYYRVNLSLALWKTEYLMKMLFLSGTPWYFENSARTVSILLNRQYIPVTLENEIPVLFAIDNDHYGITNKKWLFANIKLFEDHHIKVNFTNMGLHEENMDFGKCHQPDLREAARIEKRSHGIRRILWHLKRNFKFCKRAVHIFPSFYRYCKKIDRKEWC